LFTFIQKGQKAPFSGTLFNERATAYFLVDKELREKEFSLRMNKELEQLKNGYELKLSLSDNALKNETEKNCK
ncbi:MAG: hypothetical protein AABX37_02455, partial [Nanoarchaeota archaeon]